MKSFFFAVAMICCTHVFSQTLKGRVVDFYNNTPLAGATITLAGNSTVANNEGIFSVECRQQSKLTV